jgi:hypothetical protein
MPLRTERRDRTQMQWVFTFWVILMGSIVIVGNTFSERNNAATILLFLFGNDVLKWSAHVAGVVKENIEEVKRNVKKT